MFAFTKGKEMEQLDELLRTKKIDKVILYGFITPVKARYIKGRFIHSSYDRYTKESVRWEETAKLVKEA